MSRWRKDKSGLDVPKGTERKTAAEKVHAKRVQPREGQMSLAGAALKAGKVAGRGPLAAIDTVSSVAEAKNGPMTREQRAAREAAKIVAQRQMKKQAKREQAAEEAKRKHEQHRQQKKQEHRQKQQMRLSL